METNRTALLVMDMQMGILARMPNQGTALTAKIAGAIQAAREKNILIIFVRLGFQKGFPEVNPANQMFAGLKDHVSDDSLEGFMHIPAELGIVPGDIVVNKKRVSAFTGSELDMILRAKNITHLILSGIATSGIVLSTVTEAFDKDYQLTVLADGCADPDQEVHDFLLNKIYSKRGAVLTIDEWTGKD